MRKQKKTGVILRTIFFWLLFLGFILFVPPGNLTALIIFYLLLFLTLITLFNIFTSTARSILWSLLIITYLILRQNHLDNIINTLILLGILVTLEVYFRR